MTTKQLYTRPMDAAVGFEPLDLLYSVPRPLQVRAILISAIAIGAFSAAVAVEWPLFWRGVVALDLFSASVLFGLAACRQWVINFSKTCW